MGRVNVATWVDGSVLTKLMAELQREIVDYQPYSLVQEDGRVGVGKLAGDFGLMVAAITLRNCLNALIEKSRKANEFVQE